MSNNVELKWGTVLLSTKKRRTVSKAEPRTERIAARVEPELKRLAEKAAEKRRWSLSVYVEEAIREKLKRDRGAT